jgi:hypothetical protein
VVCYNCQPLFSLGFASGVVDTIVVGYNCRPLFSLGFASGEIDTIVVGYECRPLLSEVLQRCGSCCCGCYIVDN